MADKTIGDLPKAAALYDNDRMVLEQNGEAKHMEGRLLKDYVEPYASAAQSALEGVKEAIDNIPEGAATPIVNDLTTGGASMALSAEMGKELKSELDGLNPEDIGAFGPFGLYSGTDLNSFTKLGACIIMNEAIANRPYGSTGFGLVWNTKGYGTTYLVQNFYDAATKKMSYRSFTDGSWKDWKTIATTDYAVPLDGSKAMTGTLKLGGGVGLVHAYSYGTILDALPSDLDYAKRFGLWVRPRDQADKTNALNFVDGLTNTNYPVLHTGNKPSGSYTGNGSAAARTIEIGGIGQVVMVYSGYGIALVTANGAMCDTGEFKHLNAGSANFYRNLYLTTADDILNHNGVTYTYQVL